MAVREEDPTRAENLVDAVVEALRDGRLDKTGAVLGLLYVVYVKGDGRGVTADEAVRALRELGYEMNKKSFYGTVTRLGRKGLAESHPRGWHQESIDENNLEAVERELGRELGGSEVDARTRCSRWSDAGGTWSKAALPPAVRLPGSFRRASASAVPVIGGSPNGTSSSSAGMTYRPGLA